MTPIVSVLVIAGTDRPYLGAALNSLIQQDFQDWEAIVIECCTNPAVSSNIHHYVEKQLGDHRVRVVDYPGERGFPPHAARKWNFGLRECHGSLIAFLDDDDEKGPGWLSAMYGVLTAHPDIATVVSRGRVINADGIDQGAAFGQPSLSWESLSGASFVTTGQMVIQRSVFDAVGGFDETLACAEDWDLCLRLAKYPWHYVDYVVCHKRDKVDNACYHPEVGGHTQAALRAIILKHNLAPDTCEGCGSTVTTFIRCMTNKGFRLWCSVDCSERTLGKY